MNDSVWKPHVTVAAIMEREGTFLMVREREKGRVVINQPAGHLEKGETLIEAVIRETLEETQYEFEPTGLQGIYRSVTTYSPEITYLRFLFCGKVGAHLDGPLDQGIISAEWMSLEEIIADKDQHRSSLVMQSIDDYLNQAPCSLSIISQIFA
ncbi:MAG: NUDIX hydrolase [Gammaproteobacteria bacterium]|nr:NUDIX hydrolase [Gammaproteobacteria bacterium]